MNVTMQNEAPDDARRTPTTEPELVWTDVCALEDLWPNSGMAALLNGVQIALVRYGDGNVVYGLSNFDPFS